MKQKHLGWAVVVLLAAVVLSAFAGEAPEAASEDEVKVRAVIQLYFDGILNYDEEGLRNAFHPDAQVIGLNRAGEIEHSLFQEWVLYTRGQAPDPTGRDCSIVSVDIAGTAAMVKTDLNWPSVRYVDYLSLMKSEGEWRIVNKIFHRDQPKAETVN